MSDNKFIVGTVGINASVPLFGSGEFALAYDAIKDRHAITQSYQVSISAVNALIDSGKISKDQVNFDLLQSLPGILGDPRSVSALGRLRKC
ncbi:hypothetical protein H1W37_18975 [Stappia taiwanensis]|uniref:Uncharacterized protein n=1 Tax=Stappia taiwanensis TaxID=992267 RepID=A0A838XZ76_9HYPH|nr:hypothetical protein [Stappia taiwanensis]MBA4613746.1 hypothetical protein [Stappia taiwanensis]GGE93677.1 hypothetical protein GCM10007285_21660 [Stappia taiwanensis]